MNLEVRDFETSDHEWARQLIARYAGGSHLIARLGELLDPLTRPGIVVERDGQPVALATVDETARGMELLSLHSAVPGIGAGTRLLETALRVAVASGCPRLWLVTTNDNVPAIRFYLRRGMRVAAVHADAVHRDREVVKPAIPTHNPDTGFPIRDLIEFELTTDAGENLGFQPLPRLSDLNALPVDVAGELLRPLFEYAPRFLRRLAATRPFDSDSAMLATAREIARSMPVDEQVELIEAHPRIGADPQSVSDLSRAEQGYDAEEQLDPDELARTYEELSMLNDIYAARFGFRFVIFVGGRPKREIVPLLERALANDREQELRRALDDTIHIAADRLHRLRTAGGPA